MTWLEPAFIGTRLALILLGMAALPLCFAGKPPLDEAARLFRHAIASLIVGTCFIYSPLAIAGVLELVTEPWRLMFRLVGSLVLFSGMLLALMAFTIRSGAGQRAAVNSMFAFVALLGVCIGASYWVAAR